MAACMGITGMPFLVKLRLICQISLRLQGEKGIVPEIPQLPCNLNIRPVEYSTQVIVIRLWETG